MKRFVLVMSLLLASSASSQLMGSTKSFAESSFCKKYKCDLSEKKQSSSDPSIENFYYTINTKFESLVVVSRKEKHIQGVIFRLSGIDVVTQDFMNEHFQICKDLAALISGYNLSKTEHFSLWGSDKRPRFKNTELAVFTTDKGMFCTIIDTRNKQ